MPNPKRPSGATPLLRAIEEFEAQPQDPLYEIELALHEAGKVTGALRAVACMTRAWHTPDHPTLDMTQRCDLADLLEVLGDRLEDEHRDAERMVFAVRAQEHGHDRPA